MIGIEIGIEELAEQFLWRIVHHLYLFDDDALFVDEVGGLESRRGQDIGQQIKCGGELLIEDLYGKARFFVCGEGVEVSAEAVLFECDLLCGPAACALEYRVLDKVGNAVSSFGSFREPTRKKKPTVTERTPGIVSVKIVRPLSRRVLLIFSFIGEEKRLTRCNR